MSLRRTPLHAEHEALGAKLVEFSGWEMPLSYPAGTIAEHLACRRGVVAFDVSHLGTVRITGPDAFDRLQAELSNDLGRVAPGRAQYTHLLDEDDASVLDDIIVWWVGEASFDVVPNAANTGRVLGALGGEDVTAERAVIAVQGPEARRCLGQLSPEAAALGRFCVGQFSWRGMPFLCAGTGYTGEDGLECAVPANDAPAFWRALLAAGALPAGLGARDTLRLEAGLPLHGHELGPGITPLQAGLGWVIGWGKGPFRGRVPLEAERAAGVRRRLRAMVAAGRRPPHAGDRLVVDGEASGEVTSGNFSPVLGRGIALGFLPPGVGDGAVLTIETRSAAIEATVVKPPFHRLVPVASEP